MSHNAAAGSRPAPLTHRWAGWLGVATLALAGVLGAANARAQTGGDPPGRVAVITSLQGTSVVAGAEAGSWAPAEPRVPLTSGARLVSDPGARVELYAGATALRVQGKANLELSEVSDQGTRLTLNEGTLSAQLRGAGGDRLEVNTANLALVPQQTGEYRIDVDPYAGTTRISVSSGRALVYGEDGVATQVSAGERISFGGRRLAVTARAGAGAIDAFDQWVAARIRADEASQAARYLPRDVVGYQALDGHGQWASDITYGTVWYPNAVAADWAPYRYGQWRLIEPWGWTWVDDAPWGFAPSHYGRWTQIGPRWAWVPGVFSGPAAYAPALVGFIGGGNGNLSWGISIGGGLSGVGWFPLAPGELWVPGYVASPGYLGRINGGHRPPGRGGDGYRYQRHPAAVTVVPMDQFGGRGRYRHPSVAEGALRDTRAVPMPPPRGAWPGVGAPARGFGPIAGTTGTTGTPTAPARNAAGQPAIGGAGGTPVLPHNGNAALPRYGRGDAWGAAPAPERPRAGNPAIPFTGTASAPAVPGGSVRTPADRQTRLPLPNRGAANPVPVTPGAATINPARGLDTGTRFDRGTPAAPPQRIAPGTPAPAFEPARPLPSRSDARPSAPPAPMIVPRATGGLSTPSPTTGRNEWRGGAPAAEPRPQVLPAQPMRSMPPARGDMGIGAGARMGGPGMGAPAMAPRMGSGGGDTRMQINRPDRAGGPADGGNRRFGGPGMGRERGELSN